MTRPHDKADGPDGAHRRPEGLSDATVEALGSLSKALETTERARGHLFSFHQLTGTADLELDRATSLLREAGHHEWARRIETEVLGRNVIPGHWTFQIVEAYDRTYYQAFKDLEREAVDRLAAGRDHLYEAEMKESRRTHDHPDHTYTPDSPDARRPTAPFDRRG
ncbi:conserved hypothetical protein [Streptomyces scabiei 87.22]|uniref:Uncharacterized protein n=2 Tax=Streptomyces scabiei TaxID=1930 RepID=C9YUH7_STRSW|nr:hypothetical protein [Streptomyces scabiei]MDX2577862.1 hypothetical protein [Streptomyces scabiei]MDX2654314.1 hypothetical protein [Streptomyces scabiei]MDX2722520.1 hypothetical protein [Streptomyces scabiei]MDX2865821.1 hypothetical protein [Streptomyces scabiei]MDX2884534.1 hypothetical protein [Streptomyces scabiei]